VEVCVTDAGGLSGCDSLTVSVAVPNVAPVVNVGADGSITAGQVFTRTGSFTDSGPSPWSATVDYGSGPQSLALSGTSFTLSRTYATAGSYTVEVCVTDGGGLSGCDSLTVSVAVPNVAPVVNVGADGSITAGQVFTRTGSFTDSGPSPWSATVAFGDGSGTQGLSLSGSSFTLSHVFGTAGSYTVEVCVTDAGGLSGCDSLTVSVVVANVAPVVNVGADGSITAGQVFTRTGSFTDAGPSPWSATVNYGSGPQSLALSGSSFTLSRTYATAGTYTVEVCVTDAGGLTACDSVSVTVTSAGSAPVVAAGSDREVEPGHTVSRWVSFSDAGPSPWTATVDYGEGTGPQTLSLSGYWAFVSHRFDASGVFPVEVCITDAGGMTGCDSFTVTVSSTNAVPSVTAGGSSSITAGSVFLRSGSFSDDGPSPWTATVDYGDGTGTHPLSLSGTTFGLSHTYTAAGTYFVDVCVTDAAASTGCDTFVVTVTGANAAPSVSAGPNAVVTAGGKVGRWTAFSDDGPGPHTATIDFGDGGPAVAVPVVGTWMYVQHTYGIPGTHTATLCVTDALGATGCGAFTVTVNAPPVDPPPVVWAGSDLNVQTRRPVAWTASFTDGGGGPWTVAADFGDGTVATLSTGPGAVHLDHVYHAPGTHTVTVCVTDGSGSSACDTAIVTATAPASGLVLFDPHAGMWSLSDDDAGATSFYVGNPGDYPLMGDWDCDGVATPGLYRQSDGFVYLRNSNSQGVADLEFFFGDPGDVPLAGDFDGDGCDSVALYRPSEGRFFVINHLGADRGSLGAADVSYFFGNPGDKPFVGDFDGDGIDEFGLHRESTGYVYFRLTHTQGPADTAFFYGDPGDKIFAGDWTSDGVDTVAIYRPSEGRVYLRHSNSPGPADEWFDVGMGKLPLAGVLRR
jgi:PKD repeat protein